jgi:hypothetical protein
MGGKRKVYVVFVRKPERKSQFGKPRCRSDNWNGDYRNRMGGSGLD